MPEINGTKQLGDFEYQKFLEASDGKPAIRVVGPNGTTVGVPKASDEYGINAISEDATYKYFWFEADDLDYYIMRKHKTNKVFDYTKGTGGYAAVYVSSSAGPSGSPTFASYGTTF